MGMQLKREKEFVHEHKSALEAPAQCPVPGGRTGEAGSTAERQAPSLLLSHSCRSGVLNPKRLLAHPKSKHPPPQAPFLPACSGRAGTAASPRRIQHNPQQQARLQPSRRTAGRRRLGVELDVHLLTSHQLTVPSPTDTIAAATEPLGLPRAEPEPWF